MREKLTPRAWPTRSMRTLLHAEWQRLQKGVTLIELMVVVAIMAILAVLATPSFIGLLASASVSRSVNSFIADTRYARGEALRRGIPVTLCRTSNYSASSPNCSTGDGLAVGGWMQGWVVFVDVNGNSAFDTAVDTVLRVQEPLTGIADFFTVGAITSSATSGANYVKYDEHGRAVGQQVRWLVHASGPLNTNDLYTRTLCMNSVGRVRIQKGDLQCLT